MNEEKRAAIVQKVVSIFADEKCTVSEAKSILRDCNFQVEGCATVQKLKD
jgi:hypothetical protein